MPSACLSITRFNSRKRIKTGNPEMKKQLMMMLVAAQCGFGSTAFAAAPGRFVVTTGRGEIHVVGPGMGETLRVAARKSCFWDNHLLRVTT
jgi:hypothetical protein